MSKHQTPTRPDWTRVEFVVGTREDLTHSGITRPCRDCGRDVFTERRCPHDIPLLCETCFEALPLAETIGHLPADPDQLTDAQIVRLCHRHGVRFDESMASLEAEAARRGVDLHAIVRERLLAALKEAGIV